MPEHNNLKKTALHSLHSELGARLVPFAGYEMPVQYPAGIRHEHEAVRTHAGLFDISHMGQIKLSGNDVPEALEKLVPGDIVNLDILTQRYSVFTNEDGGVIDDLMITRMADHFILVVNAACLEKDLDYLRQSLPKGIAVTLLSDQALLALQGPEAAAVLAGLHAGISQLAFMQAGTFYLESIHCLIHRCGYTGEDGFEISVAADNAEKLARVLLDSAQVAPVGLGARDSLRLEAGLCLYGHELDETITPVEAGLGWVIAAKYRNNAEVAAFPGARRILAQLKSGPGKLRGGFVCSGKVPVREGMVVLDSDGEVAGTITSGGYGQTVGAPIAMGYMRNTGAIPDKNYQVEIRGRLHRITGTALPFVKHRYHKQ